MFVDGRQIADGETMDADVAIVGAGAAGIAIARRLGRSGSRVLLIESGERAFELETQELADGAVVGLPYFPLQSARLRYFGGTTNHWSGTCRPFEAFDLEPHGWIPNSGWPFGLGEIEPHYAEAAEIVGLPSTEWDAEGWIGASPYDALDVRPDRFENRVAQNVRARRRRVGDRYADELGASSNVTVLLNANLVDIRLTDELDEVTALDLHTLDGRSIEVRARTHVLAAGGLENPRLLLAANRQLPAGIGNGSDLVGRFFLEHPRFVAAEILPFSTDTDLRFYDAHDAAGSRITGYLSLPPEVRASEELVDVQFRLEPRYPAWFRRSSGSSDVSALLELAGVAEDEPELLEDLGTVADDLTSWRDFVAFGGPLPVPLPDVVGEAVGATAEERASLVPELVGDIATIVYGDTIGPIATDRIAVTARIDPVPNPDSRVRLGGERDALGIPRIELDWRLTDADRRSVGRAVELLGAEVGRLGIGRVRRVFDPSGTSWPDDMTGGYHHMGTTRMHEDPGQGVVDRNSRVHGMRNLYVTGGSVFPTGGSGTPTLTIVALALRLAAHLEGGAA